MVSCVQKDTPVFVQLLRPGQTVIQGRADYYIPRQLWPTWNKKSKGRQEKLYCVAGSQCEKTGCTVSQTSTDVEYSDLWVERWKSEGENDWNTENVQWDTALAWHYKSMLSQSEPEVLLFRDKQFPLQGSERAQCIVVSNCCSDGGSYRDAVNVHS